jgi:hypothetical protein
MLIFSQKYIVPALENLTTDIAIMVYSMFNENVYKDVHQFTGKSAIFKKKYLFTGFQVIQKEGITVILLGRRDLQCTYIVIDHKL